MSRLPQFLASPGELGRLIAEFDWSTTPLGPLENWPQSLRTSVSLMLNTTHPIWIGWGPQATFLYNDAYIAVLGEAKHQWALGRPASEVWAEIWDYCTPLVDKVFNKAEATFVEAEQLFMDRAGWLEEKWFTFSYSPIADESGGVGGLFCPSADVTTSKLNARRLATLSALSAAALGEHTVASACAGAMSAIAQNPNDIPFAALYLAEAESDRLQLRQTIHLSNPPPLPADMAPGRDAELLPVDHMPGLPLGLADRPLTEALVLPLEIPGQQRPAGLLMLGISPVTRLDAQYYSFLELVAGQVSAALQNATAAEEQRRRAEALAELDRAKTTFFSNVSHEFRTPLTLMLGPIEDAINDSANRLGPVQHERLQVAHRNALRLQKLVNTLLDFSRVQANRMQAHYTETDLAAQTADLASCFRSVVESAGLTLSVDCQPLSSPAWVDAGLWEKIVLNLLSNAFKFTFEGRIGLSLREQDGHAMLEVSDTGVGIAAQHLGRIFERFQRVEGTRSRTHEGSGIGLALVRDLVELHRGTIAVRSEPGVGTAFTITLPLGHAHIADEQIGEAPAATDHGAREAYTLEATRWLPESLPDQSFLDLADESSVLTVGARVLVADDNTDMREYLVRLLRQRWHVTAVSNGREALAEAARQRPDLIISDVMMPELDGFGLLAALRDSETLHDIPVMLLSARAGEEARIEGLRAGADDYLVKPFSARELMTRVDSHLVRARIRQIERADAARMATVFMQVPAAIAILRGPSLVYELLNERYSEIIGGRDVMGMPLRQAFPELESQGLINELEHVMRTGHAVQGRARRVLLARGPLGESEECYFDYVHQPVRNAHGQVDRVALVAFEVTELVRARREAEIANRTKDDFLAMLGHELRNPLSPILIALELMRLKGIGALQKEHAVIERQAQHMVRMVDDLLDVARIAQGKITLRKERVELARLVAQAVETVSPLLEERHHYLRVDVPVSGMEVQADPARFTQVLVNLLTNAAKYTNSGGQISLQAGGEDGLAVVQVRDNGIGIAPEMLPQLFDKFVQERQALDRSRGGLGLGLAIARSIASLHGGSVSASSEGIGTGSEFTVRMPLAPAQAGQPQQAPAARVDNPGGCPRRRVLLVDDNPDVLDGLRTLLEVHGHQVETAADPVSALRASQSFTPDIAILDIGLPGMDGYELAAELRQQPGFAETHLVALTGYGQPADRVRSHAAGFAAHLVKPVSASQLYALLNEPD
ncbi:ATP-binding protein [Pseudoduganella sp. RAF53_2]|uniref:ATP-binding protein n=1 Tax=unclassified Pseudoduganella TaxID=2637179 RepID=UPI003F9834D0